MLDIYEGADMRRAGVLLLAGVLVAAGTGLLALGRGAHSPVPVRQHGPRRAVGVVPERVVGGVKVWASGNWAGYAVVGSSFTQAKGSWIVPAVDCVATPGGSTSFWVGIDGWSDATVEQTGTDSDCDGEKPHYYAWYEFAPKGGVTIDSVPVSAGDRMSGEVNYDGSEFTVTITDEATGETFSTSAVIPVARRASAEWITENNGIGLSDFGVAPFGQDFTGVSDTNSATDDRTSGEIRAFGKRVQASTIVSQGVDDAVPSSLSRDGSRFTVTWKAE
jgi:hypothetical protein